MLHTKTIKSTTISSPTFENDMSIDDCVKLLHDMSVRLIRHPDDRAIYDTILDELSQKHIITMTVDEDYEKHIWIMTPLQLREDVLERPLLNRIVKLFTQGGVWHDKQSVKSTVSIESRFVIPFHVEMGADLLNKTLTEDIPSLAPALLDLTHTVIQQFANGEDRVGVFDKPSAIINRNLIEQWIRDHDHTFDPFIANSITIRSLKDILTNTKYVTATA